MNGSFFGVDLLLLITTAGYLGLFGIIFAESGLFIGFFLPGDSLLFAAGLLAAEGVLNIWILVPLTFAAAILGDNFGYAFGRRVGPRIFTREESLLFRRDYLDKAKTFYEKHGGSTIVLARFLPIIRTFAPILAGVGRMRYSDFLFYNFLGAVLWAIGLTSLGFYLGNLIPNAERYLVPLVLAIIIISSIPSLFHFLGGRKFLKR